MTPIEARVLHISPGELLYRYYQLYSNSAGLMKLDVFCFAPTCKLDTLTVLTSVQTPHRGLIGWMSHISTQRTNNETSIFKMSPLRLNSIFTASSLSSPIVCQHLAELHNNTHNGNTGKTDSCGISLETCVASGVFPRWMEDLC